MATVVKPEDVAFWTSKIDDAAVLQLPSDFPLPPNAQVGAGSGCVSPFSFSRLLSRLLLLPRFACARGWRRRAPARQHVAYRAMRRPNVNGCTRAWSVEGSARGWLPAAMAGSVLAVLAGARALARTHLGAPSSSLPPVPHWRGQRRRRLLGAASSSPRPLRPAPPGFICRPCLLIPPGCSSPSLNRCWSLTKRCAKRSWATAWSTMT